MTHWKYHGFILAAGVSLAGAGALPMMTGSAAAQNFTTDVTVQGSLCVGVDCTTSESFGFDTIRLKENNLRINFQDTSTSASFPSNDWTIEANETSNGGKNWLRFFDVTAARAPFTVEAGAQIHTLYVEADGDIGVKTNEPVVDLHILEGNTPTIRLHQDGSDGFSELIWDIAGNEANFFVRDVTNGSDLPLRIFPNAGTDALVIEGGTGHIGLGLTSPTAPLHIRRNADTNTAHLILDSAENPGGGGAGRAELWFIDGETGTDNDALRMQLNDDDFNITFNGSGGGLRIGQNSNVTVPNGDLIVSGTISSGGTNLNVPDYVFAPDYELMPLDDVAAFIAENSHLPHIPSAAEVNANGLNLTHMQLAILKTVEELTLHTLDQQATIRAQAETIEALETRLEALETH